MPVSLRCQQGSTGNDDEEEDARKDSKVATASSSADPEGRCSVEEADEELEAESGRRLQFVTPRSRMRCRAAAGRRMAKEERRASFGEAFRISKARDQPSLHVDPSPRSVTVRLGQLGMDQGIWSQSPLKLELDRSTTSLARTVLAAALRRSKQAKHQSMRARVEQRG